MRLFDGINSRFTYRHPSSFNNIQCILRLSISPSPQMFGHFTLYSYLLTRSPLAWLFAAVRFKASLTTPTSLPVLLLTRVSLLLSSCPALYFNRITLLLHSCSFLFSTRSPHATRIELRGILRGGLRRPRRCGLRAVRSGGGGYHWC